MPVVRVFAIACFFTFSPETICCGQDHSLWEISTRCNPNNIGWPEENLPVGRFVGGTWLPASESKLHQHITDEPAWTVVYVHGNLTDVQWSRSHALHLFRSISRQADRPVRLISWSWPSDNPCILAIPAKRAEEKKALMKANAFQLAYLLQRLGHDEPKGVIGFSFGAAIVGGALHLGAGGDIDGIALGVMQSEPNQPACPQSLNVRLGFVAPAFDRNALTPRGEFSQTASTFSQLVNLYNSRDPVLKHFRMFDRAAPQAAGYFGLYETRSEPLQTDPTNIGQIVQYDCKAIGPTHAFMEYYTHPAFGVMLDNVLGK